MRAFIRGGVKAEVAAVVGMTLIAILAAAVLAAIGVKWLTGQSQEHAPATTFTDSGDGQTYKIESVAPITDSVSATATGTFTDKRDGQTYKTVKIGKQTWMAQNINYQTKGGSWCYNDRASYCKQYGKLYDWKTARTVCPAGWHLPSVAEWDNLASTLGGTRKKGTFSNTDYEYFYWDGAGKKLKARSGWNNRKDGSSGNGTDEFGFSALPGGDRDGSDGSFFNAGYNGYWWTATEYDASDAYGRSMSYYDDYVSEDSLDLDFGRSVRCIADNP